MRDYGLVRVGRGLDSAEVSPTTPPGLRQTQRAHKGPEAFLALRTKPNDFLNVVNKAAWKRWASEPSTWHSS